MFDSILQNRRFTSTLTCQKVGRTYYFVTSKYFGEENILDKLGEIMTADYEREPEIIIKTSDKTEDLA